MGKHYLLICSFFFSLIVNAQSPTCNIPAIIQAFTAAGYTQFNVGGQPCNLYFYNQNSTTWQAAQNAAQALGGNLATISSQAENDSVVAGLLASGVASNTVVWIGFTDAQSEGNWVWVDGTPTNFTNWNGAEPNNSSGFPGVGENGGQLQLSNGRWNDLMTDNSGLFPAPTGRSIFKVSLCPQIAVNAPVGCQNQPTTAVASTLFGSAPYTYAWAQFPNPAPIDNDSALTVTIAAPAVYVAGVQDRYGCSDTAQVLVNVQPCFVPPGCDIAAIDAAMAAGGFIFMNVQNQPCSRYYYNNTPTTNWNTAQAQAASVGGNLVSVNSAAENAALLSAAQAQGFSGGIWIGFTDAASEGNWVWSNGSSNSYTNWNGSEPSNSGGFPCYTDEDGAIMQLSNGQWNDLALNNGCPGAASFRSVIEIDLCPVVNAQGPSATVCENQPTQLTASTLLGSPVYNYVWTNLSNAANAGNTATVNVTPTASTSYEVASTDRYGCLAKDTIAVTTQSCAVISTCNIPAVDAAMAAAGFQLLNVQNFPCGRYYYNPATTNNWNNAQAQAAAVGATLLTVSSLAENNAVWNAAVAAGVTGGLWIGYSDQVTEGTWLWQDGSTGTFTNWNTNEPSNSTCFGSNAGEDAAVIQMSNGRWNDVYTGPQGVCLAPAAYASLIKVNLCPVTTALANPTTICTGQSSSLTASTLLGSSPYTYTWSVIPANTPAGTGTPLSVSPTVSSSYQVISQDRFGCQARDTVQVTVAGANNQTFTVAPSTICAGETVTVTYTGSSPAAAQYNWNFGGGSIVSGSGQGPYTIQYNTAGPVSITLDVTLAGCASPQVSQAITVNQAPVADAGPDVTVCNGDNVTLGTALVPGLQYQWFPSTGLDDATAAQPVFTATNTSGTAQTIEFILFSGQLGCVASDTVLVTVAGDGNQSFTVLPASFCAGEITTVTYTGNSPASAQFTWNFGGGTVVSGSGQGPYSVQYNTAASVTITLDVNDAGCTPPQVSQTITVNPAPLADAGPDITICSGGSVTLGTPAVPGLLYQWIPATGLSNAAVDQPLFTAANTGATPQTVTYIVVSGQVGCQARDTVEITVDPVLSTTISAAGPLGFCAGGSVTVNSDSSFLSYAWSNGGTASSVTLSQPGSITLSATDGQGCQYISAPLQVSVFPNPSVSLITSSDESCFGYGDGSISVSGSGGSPAYSYQWNTTPTQSGTTANNLQTGSYTVTLTDANSCTATGTYSISSPDPLLLSLDSLSDLRCYGDLSGYLAVSVSGSSLPYTYSWSNGAAVPVLSALPAGDYTLTVTDALGCSVTADYNVTQPDSITLEPVVPDSIRFGSEATLSVDITPIGIYSYQWSPSLYLSCADCSTPIFSGVQDITYNLTITDQNGCTATREIAVAVIADKVVYIPNVFTPDGNGANDDFRVFTNGIRFSQLMIFNRTGEKVFQSNNITQSWDGRYKGTEAMAGVYTYYLELVFLDGDRRTYQGSLTLLR